ncbi:hypothetical protein CABS03_13914 [Colletotrichum abscissum]|uniref:Uncharacterized protein n=1 Tax=Colletotrichum abscissum TaxID=1671311 RepID=A0A9Q0B560_9PEZI|nr:hypothetical protein CABS02_06209 [Colletotrichum abscissum]
MSLSSQVDRSCSATHPPGPTSSPSFSSPSGITAVLCCSSCLLLFCLSFPVSIRLVTKSLSAH